MKPDHSATPAGRRHVLLVDDFDLNLAVAQSMLEERGVSSDVAQDGAEALKLLDAAAEGTYQAVLMDVQMPVMDGLQCTRELRKDSRFRDLPVIAMTASDRDDDREACTLAGMNDRVSKPIDETILWKVLEPFLRPAVAADAARVATSEMSGGAAPTQIPQIAGLDTVDGLQRFLSDGPKYLRVISRFAASQRGAAEAIAHAVRGGDMGTAHRHAHALAGLAGTIGARDLHRQAQELESVLRDGTPAMAVQPIAQLSSALNALVAAIDAGVVAGGHDAPAAVADPDAAMLACRRMEDLLAEGDSGAIEVFETAAPVLRGASPELHGQLAAAFAAYDLDAALPLVCAMTSAIERARPGNRGASA